MPVKFRFDHIIGVFLFVALVTYCDKDNPDLPDPEQPVNWGEAIPFVVVETGSGTIVDEPKIPAKMDIIQKGDTSHFSIGIEYRGSTSQSFDKKSYGIELWDSEGNDISLSVLGLPEEEDWILYGPYSDKTFFRNVITYDLARGLGHYSSRTRFIELQINGDYLGVYVFMEKLKRDKNRIDINKLKDDENSGEDLTGGYILKIDKSTGDSDLTGWEGNYDYNSTNSFRSRYDTDGNLLPYAAYGTKQSQETYFLYEYPDADDITPEQKDYIQSYMDTVEMSILGDAGLAYEDYLDLSSFVDYFLLNELSHNPDAYRLSTFIYKDKGGKLVAGPVWDYNIAWGNDSDSYRSSYDTWIYRYNDYLSGDLWLVPFWWEVLVEDDAFRSLVKARWEDLRANDWSDSTLENMINQYYDELVKAEVVDRNYDRWRVLGVQLPFNGFVGQTYDEEIDFLKSWITKRTAWMDSQIGTF